MLSLLKETLLFFIEVAPYMVLGLFFVGLLHIFISKEFVANHIGSKSIISIIKSAILGVPLPLCSCGVVPTAVYLSKNGASKGSVISFLISTPQTGVDSIIATYGMLGPVFAVFRPIAAFISGIFGGIVANRFDGELNLEKDNPESCTDDSCKTEKPASKIKEFFEYAFIEFLDDISLQFIAGVIIAGIISFAIPADFFVKYNIGSGITGMLLMITIGIPMYVCATSSIPIGLALLAKGVSPGAVFVFLAVGPMTNAASITILIKVLGKKLVITYIAIGSALAIAFGYLLNFIFNNFNLSLPEIAMHHEHSSLFNKYFLNAISLFFALMLLLSIFRKLKGKFSNRNKEMEKNKKIFKISGMSCNHCKTNVTNAISSVEGVDSVDVNLDKGEAIISGSSYEVSSIISAVEHAGYKASSK